jgi:hypothetical protein
MSTDLSPEVLLRNLSSGFNRERYKPDGHGGEVETNLYKLARATSSGLHAETGQALDDLAPQRFDSTAEQGFLDNRAVFWNVPRRANEEGDDGPLRLRLGQRKLVLWGATCVDEMLSALATLLRTDVRLIGFTENIDELGAFEPGLITFNVSPGAFQANGVSDVAAAIAGLQVDMESVAPAGVRVRIISQGTALWDDAGTVWDVSGTWSETEDVIGAMPTPPTPPPLEGGVGDDPVGEDPVGG